MDKKITKKGGSSSVFKRPDGKRSRFIDEKQIHKVYSRVDGNKNKEGEILKEEID